MWVWRCTWGPCNTLAVNLWQSHSVSVMVYLRSVRHTCCKLVTFSLCECEGVLKYMQYAVNLWHSHSVSVRVYWGTCDMLAVRPLAGQRAERAERPEWGRGRQQARLPARPRQCCESGWCSASLDDVSVCLSLYGCGWLCVRESGSSLDDCVCERGFSLDDWVRGGLVWMIVCVRGCLVWMIVCVWEGFI